MTETREITAAYGNVKLTGPSDEVESVLSLIQDAISIQDRRSALIAKSEKTRVKRDEK